MVWDWARHCTIKYELLRCIFHLYADCRHLGFMLKICMLNAWAEESNFKGLFGWYGLNDDADDYGYRNSWVCFTILINCISVFSSSFNLFFSSFYEKNVHHLNLNINTHEKHELLKSAHFLYSSPHMYVPPLLHYAQLSFPFS